ncbi:amidohydrolase family protein [Aminobacter aganoensis]|uniref:Cytosine/adenosine deaminase-related metal-dependent hydrolase n=1 Tax=Aminobacter aganoensis TaxID=83264 RepID=A0A7X0FB51_9HYPH|nr:amidohydrolase family protein [Aminobacter aganoensis]MBB6356258.1 cytosine/adenosine deaminase-related metal-dependent hydrolase [Aminobacter aganoensis]
MKRTLIKSGWLVTMDDAIQDIRNGELLMIGDKIAAVGLSLDVEADEVIDARDMIVMPGLVNAHIHTWQTGMRGIGAEWPSGAYHKHVHGNMATFYNAEDTYLGNLVGAINQIDNGVTTIFDWCHILRDLEMAERAVDALEESGIRAVFGHGTAKPPARPGEAHHSEIAHPRDRVEALRRGRFSADDRRVTLALAILGPEISTAKVCLADYALAREFGLLSTCHVSYPSGQRVQENGWPALAAKGLLGPDHNICHGNALSDDDLNFILDRGVTVTPTVMLELQAKAEPPLTVRIRSRGALPSLGIDTEPLCSGDMFNEMRAAWMHARNFALIAAKQAGQPPVSVVPVKAREVLEWATMGGAKALRMDDRIGSLTPGKKADLVFVGTDDLDLYPVYDPAVTVVGYASGANVDSVFIDGQPAKRHGKLLFGADVLRQRKAALAGSVERVMRDAGVQLPLY